MKFLIFRGGKEQLIVRVDAKRRVSINYPTLFGNEFIDEEMVLKNTDRNDVAKYKNVQKNSTDKGFEKYLIKEFTSNKWLGFELIKIKIK